MALQTTIQPTVTKKGSLETFAGKLLDKIINAGSPDAVERFIAVAVKALGTNKVNGYIIQRFIDRVTQRLDGYQPANTQQAANCKMAKERLATFRQAISRPV